MAAGALPLDIKGATIINNILVRFLCFPRKHMKKASSNGVLKAAVRRPASISPVAHNLNAVFYVSLPSHISNQEDGRDGNANRLCPSNLQNVSNIHQQEPRSLVDS